MKRTILIVDNNSEMAEILEVAFSARYQTMRATTGEEAIRLATTHQPDLILLKTELPDRLGVEVCAQLRSDPQTAQIQVIMLSESSDLELQLDAFEVGADDFMVRPFSMKEVLARVSSRMRRVMERGDQTDFNPQTIQFENLTLDLDRVEVRVDDTAIPISVLEFNLLKYFVSNREKVLSRDRILSGVWEGASVSDRTVDSHIVSLRKKLDRARVSLVTVYGAGYALKTVHQARSTSPTLSI